MHVLIHTDKLKKCYMSCIGMGAVVASAEFLHFCVSTQPCVTVSSIHSLVKKKKCFFLASLKVPEKLAGYAVTYIVEKRPSLLDL